MSNLNRRSVIQLAYFGAPYSGNFIASLLALEAVLKKAGLRQILIFPDIARDKAWLAELCNNNVSVYLLPEKVSLLYLAKEIARIAAMENAIILHSHFTAFDVPGWLAGILMGLKKKSPAIVWHCRSAFPVKRTFIRRLKDMLKLKLMGRSVEVVTVSEELRQSLAIRGFAGSAVVVPNGIDVVRATRSSKSKAEIRRELGIPESALLLLSFGWEPITKGVDLLLAAAEKFGAETEFTLLIIGTARLREFVAERYGEIWPGWLRVCDPRESVADLYRAADIFVSPSRWEGFSNAVGEAMANALPVISSNIKGLEWARTAEGVIFFDSENIQGVIEAIKQVISWSPTEIRSLGACNREFISTKYAVNTWAQNILKIYKRLLNRVISMKI
jgi:glycosyltransferase involved in cell wall biosynthesis